MDVLGAPEELFVDSGDGAKVTILDMGRATLELSTPEQVELIDRVEVGARVSPRLRVAFEVSDAESAVHDLTAAGASVIAPPTRPAQATAWAAESARLPGRPTVDMWAAVARHWDRLDRPHDAAYCRWRGAQVALATDQGTIALRLLRRAAREAREHVPLSAAIAETMQTARRAPQHR